MWLVDNSVWINHFRHQKADLVARLSEGLVLMHPFVIGELACGNLKDRTTVLSYLMAIPFVTIATDDEVLRLVERKKLWGRGTGWIDAHLLYLNIAHKLSIVDVRHELARSAEGFGAYLKLNSAIQPGSTLE